MNDTRTPTEFEPTVHNINEVQSITGADAATYLGVHYSTVLNLVNSRKRYLKAEKIGATLFITWESAQAEKIRRAGLQKEIDELSKDPRIAKQVTA